MSAIDVAVPRKGRPLEAVLERFATRADALDVADSVISTLRYEKAVTKGDATAERELYDRLAAYSDTTTPSEPEYTLLRDDRDGRPRRIVFDSLTLTIDETEVTLVGREEPFRSLRTHEFALGFDSADLVLEEVVQLRSEPVESIAGINERIDPLDTDVRVVGGMGDTVYHTLLGTPSTVDGLEPPLTRAFVDVYEGDLCISPRYERLVEAVLGTEVLDNISFTYPRPGETEEAAIEQTGLGVYLTVTGSTAREHGLVLGEQLFPSETVLLENSAEVTAAAAAVRDSIVPASESALTID
jgi:hypothetical protein